MRSPGAKIFMGNPGKPAPEPMSVADFGEGSSLPNSCFAAKNDSPKWRVMIC